VRSGDTLASIAVRLGTTADELARANGIADPNLIVVGSTLRGVSTPGAAASVSAPAPSRASIAPLLDAAAARHGVNPSLVRAVAWQESGWNQSAVSSVGALGVMQLMPETASWAGPALLGRSIDPAVAGDNIDAGVAFLAHLIRVTGDVPTALAGYNQGLASVRKRGLFNETQRYVASVQALVGTV
jgi:soluble lytic murein transglycosylase-like protein